MENITFSTRLKKYLCDLLDEEASEQSRNRNQQLEMILKERYHAHAPPVAPIRSSKSRNGHKANRKTKAEVN